MINIVFLLSPLIIILRLIKKKEHPKRFIEKFCYSTKKRVKGKLIWFHGASIGEVLSVIPLVEKLEKDKKISQILITSNTLSSSKIFSDLRLKKTIHQFFPIDTDFHSKKFLQYWRPSIAIFIDSEIWPNMIKKIKKNSTLLVLLNGRITKKSFNRWKTIPTIAKNLFNKFDMCLVSNKESKRHLRLLGAHKIKNFGNLKFCQSAQLSNRLNLVIKKQFLARKIWCASSTHKTEEGICLDVHKKLKIKYKDLLTIIIPRHAERKTEILEKIKELNLKVISHSSNKKIGENIDIYLVDTYGETKSFYQICNTIFLGGSLIKHGGQNPIEAAIYGCKIMHGKNISNFEEIYNLLNKLKITTKINNTFQMVKVIDNEFKNIKYSKNAKNKINTLGKNILKITAKEINSLTI